MQMLGIGFGGFDWTHVGMGLNHSTIHVSICVSETARVMGLDCDEALCGCNLVELGACIGDAYYC